MDGDDRSYVYIDGDATASRPDYRTAAGASAQRVDTPRPGGKSAHTSLLMRASHYWGGHRRLKQRDAARRQLQGEKKLVAAGQMDQASLDKHSDAYRKLEDSLARPSLAERFWRIWWTTDESGVLVSPVERAMDEHMDEQRENRVKREKQARADAELAKQADALEARLRDVSDQADAAAHRAQQFEDDERGLRGSAAQAAAEAERAAAAAERAREMRVELAALRARLAAAPKFAWNGAQIAVSRLLVPRLDEAAAGLDQLQTATELQAALDRLGALLDQVRGLLEQAPGSDGSSVGERGFCLKRCAACVAQRAGATA
jgi:DNA repair exonuclease SbcCD ATPase subunit